MQLKVKTEDSFNSRSFGIVEEIKIRQGNSRKTIEGIAVLDIALGTLAEPNFYFGESFMSLEDACNSLEEDFSDGLDRYMSARKAVHSLFGANKPIVQFSVTRHKDGTYTNSLNILKPVQKLVTTDTIVVYPSPTPKEYVQGMRDQLVYLVENVDTRTEYYNFRHMMYTERAGQMYAQKVS